MNTPQVLELVPGLTRRQLDAWCQKGYLGPAHAEPGTGNPRDFSMIDVMSLKQVVRLLAAGLTLAKAWEVTLDDDGWMGGTGIYARFEQIQLVEGVWLLVRP